MSKKPNMNDDQSSAEQRARKRAKEIRAFMGHFGTFVSIGLFFLILDLLTNSNRTDPHGYWFYWPMLPWGIAVAIHGWNVFMSGRFFDDAWEERHVKKVLARQEGGSTEPASAPTESTGSSDEMRQLTDQAAALVDSMRTSARRVPDPEVRRKALDACAASDQALAAIMEHPEELPLARDFVTRFLQPASMVVSDYSRLANRNVPSARETLTKVEQQDLPLITRKANELYDRLHRGTLIDLEVAREMLTREVPDANFEELPHSGE